MQEYKWPLMKDTITYRDRWELAKFIMKSNRFTQGEKVAEFEQAWNKWIGGHRSLFVTSGSTANFLIVASVMEKYGLKKGDKVLVPACTWVTNVNPIFQLGLEPVFCDINLDDYSFCHDALANLAKEHKDIKMAFITHLLGIPTKVEKKLREFWPKLLIIDDVCESHGATMDGANKVGSLSLGASFSFYYGHHMSTIEGGMVTTYDEELYDLMKMKRSHGMARLSEHFAEYAAENPEIEKSFLFVTDGYNFRNTELAAVLGLSQLKKLDGFIKNRRARYAEFVTISNYHGLFYPLQHHMGNSSFCFPFVAKEADTKEKLIAAFQKHGIEYRPIVSGNLLYQPYLQGKYPLFTTHGNVDILHKNGVYIGNNQFVTKQDMSLLEEIIAEVKNGK